MEDQQPIEELFRDSLLNHEEPVNPELWSRISQQLQAPVTDSLPNTDPVSSITTTSGWLGGGALPWIAAAVITLSAGTGAYLYLANRTADPQPQEKPVISTETDSEIPFREMAPVTDAIVSGDVNTTPAKSNSTGDQNPVDLSDSEIQQVSAGAVIATQSQTESSSPGKATPTSKDPTITNNQTTPVDNNQSNAVTETPTAVTARLLTAAPEKGTAPLKVALHYKGETDRLQWDFGDGQTLGVLNQTEHTFTEPGEYTVTVKGVNRQQKPVNESITIRVLADLTISGLPNVLTPNYDGLNDIFAFNSSQFAEIEVIIYDQAGNQLHRFRDTESGWDGKLANGKEAGEGTYIYIIFARSHDQRQHQQKGLLRLIR